MGIAALILGIISLVLGFIPFCNIFALIPAIVGLILGIIDWVKKNKEAAPKGKSIAGTICSAIAIAVILVYYFAFVALAGSTLNKASKSINKALEEMNTSYQYSEYDFN